MPTPKDLSRDVGGFIRDLRRNARISLRQLAEQAGVSNPYLSQIERGLRKPSAEVLQQLASALRVSTPAMYLRAGLLDSEGQQGVLAAIAVDPELTMAQKQSLSQIYETFRNENQRRAATEPADVPAETRIDEPPQVDGDLPDDEILAAVAATEAGGAPADVTPTGAAPVEVAPEATPKPARKTARAAAAKTTKAAKPAQKEQS
jgi:transcriptional regulator with XRE-family HTH domain